MAKKRGKAGDGGRRPQTPGEAATGQPLAMTQEEVDAKIEGGQTPALDRRIRRSARHKPIGRLRSKKFSPAPISTLEMAKLQRARRLSKTLSRRILQVSEQDTSATEVDDSKEAPVRPAAGQRRKR